MGSHVSHFAGSPICDWESRWTISKKMTAYEGKREPYSSLSPFGFHLSTLSSSKPGLLCMHSVKENVVVDCFYIALFSTLEQTHCAHVTWSHVILNEWLAFYSAFLLNIHRSGVLQRWHGWCHVELLPSRRVLCTPYNYAPYHVTSCKYT